MPLSKVDQIRNLLKSIETGDPDPVAVVNEARYVQHNPQTEEGSEGLAQLFARISKTGPKVNMVRGFEDGEYVFAHMEYDFASRKICFEVFRFEDGQAVEHWDNIQERQGPNISGHTMVDGATEVADLELTETNRAFVQSFVESVLISRHHDQLDRFLGPIYIEHNPRMVDGTSGLREALQETSEGIPVIQYQKLHRVLAQGNFVLSVCEGTFHGAHAAFYDLFRIESSVLIEHWDTTEKVAPKSEWKNNNGKF